jgi:thiol-disulfide isomerase/thioredoxin
MLNKPYISNQLKQNQTTSNNYKLPPTTSKNTMAYTESNMIPIGTLAPAFELLDPSSGKLVSLQEIAAGAKATVVMFLCNHCPYVLYINPEIVRIVAEYKAKGVAFVGINSNDAETHPEDGPDKMAAHAAEVGYDFAYLYDETQEVARAYDAACTPDFYIFDQNLKLAYRGQLDSSRPKRNPIESTGEDLRAALDAVLEGKAPNSVQRPSGGCNIKWKS